MNARSFLKIMQRKNFDGKGSDIMAERRMFAKSIVLSDAFLDMPLSARCLYFTLGMLADDDGFVGSPKAIMRQCGASQDDMAVLLQKRFVLGFESGVIVIKHWRMNNYLQSDRKKSTTYLEELSQLQIDDKGAYTDGNSGMYTKCIQNVYIGKDSIDKDSIDASDEASASKEVKHIFGEYKHVRLTDRECDKLVEEYGTELTDAAVKFLDEYIEMKGYKAKNHYLAIRKWVIDAVKEERQRKNRKTPAQNFKAQELEGFYQMAAEWAESGE